MVAFCFYSAAFTKENNLKKIHEYVVGREYSLAINELEKLERVDRKFFEANNYDYFLARLFEREGDFASAAAYYQSVINRNSILKSYAMLHLSKLSRFSQNLLLERVFLYEILLESPKSFPQKISKKRLERNFYETQDFNEVERILLSDFSQTDDNETYDRETLILSGLTLLQTGKTDEARKIFAKVLEKSPNPTRPDDLDLVAVQKLDEIDGINNKDEFKLSSQEHFQRGKVYYFNREFNKARLHFSIILEKFPQFTDIAECLYLIGRSYFLEDNYNEAIKWFERLMAEFPDTEFAKEALSQAASAYSRVNKPKEAISRYKRFIEKYSDDEKASRAYLNIVDILRDTSEESDAVSWIEKTINEFKGKSSEAIALFTKIRMKIARNDWTNALKEIEELEKIVKPNETIDDSGGTNLTEIRFLKGYCLEQLKEYDEAIEVYLSIPDGRNSYYGWRATERLSLLAENETSKSIISQKFNHYSEQAEQKLTTSNADQIRQSAQKALRLTNDAEKRKKLLEIIKESYRLLPSYRKILPEKALELKEILALVKPSHHKKLASALLSLNLYDEGTPELELALHKERLSSKNTGISYLNAETTINPKIAFTLAEYYVNADTPYRALIYLEPLWKNIPEDYPIEAISQQHLKLLYPAPYKDLLLANKEKSKIDPRFVLAIMKQESRFYPYAKSVSAARGLMQFIPSTANQVANELKLERSSTDDLYDPKIAILLGNAYLSKLFIVFPNQPQAVAAAYNAGEKNMMRWFLRAKSNDPDRYVPEILFAQSKDYVQKVMANYRIYKAIYNENLEPIGN